MGHRIEAEARDWPIYRSTEQTVVHVPNVLSLSVYKARHVPATALVCRSDHYRRQTFNLARGVRAAIIPLPSRANDVSLWFKEDDDALF